MESKRPATGFDPLHIRYWRQCNRFPGQKNYEPARHQPGLAVGNHLYSINYNHLADGCTHRQHSFWAVSVFPEVYP